MTDALLTWLGSYALHSTLLLAGLWAVERAGGLRRLQVAHTVPGLLDGHLLEERHEVHRGQRRGDHLHHGISLGPDRPGPGETGDFGVHVEEACDASGGWRVHDHGVVERTAIGPLATHGLLALACEQDVADSGGDGGGEVDGTHLAQRRPGATQVVEQLEVLDERLFGVDGQREHLATARCHSDPTLLVRQRWNIERLGQALSALDLDHEHLSAVGGQGESKCRGNGGLPGPTLPGDHVQADTGPVGRASADVLALCTGATTGHS